MADAVIITAIVPRLVAAHVKEDPVEIVRREEFFNNLQGVFLLIASIQTDLHISVIFDNLTSSSEGRPFRVAS